MDFLDQFQFGIDIATSLAIIGAFVSWIIKENREKQARIKADEKQKQIGINNETRAIAVSRVQETTLSLSGLYKQLAEADGLPKVRGDDPIPYLDSLLENRPELVPGYIAACHAQLDHLGSFYEEVQGAKYLLFPVLDSIPEGGPIIREIKDDMERIRVAYNGVASGWISLIGEFDALVSELKTLPPESGLSDDVRKKAISILQDEDYWDWVQSFVPPESRDVYRQFWSSREQGFEPTDMDVFNTAFKNLVAFSVESPSRLYAQIFIHFLGVLQESRKECKNVLCSMSGICAHLLTREREGGESLEATVRRFQSDEYLALDSEIR